MKRALTLLAVTMLTANSTGCSCFPCLRGCWPSAAVPTYAAVPAAYPTPVYAAAPQQYTVPQYAAPQYAVAAPQGVYSDPGCGTPYAAEMGCGMPYTAADPGCGYMDSGYSMPSQQEIYPGPAQ